MRKVDYVLQLVEEHRVLEEMIREALYRDTDEAIPGHLADSVARLFVSLGSTCRIITTNFDDQIENSLRNYFEDDVIIRSLSIKQEDLNTWREGAENCVDVLHLHGVVRRTQAAFRRPIVLSESDFLNYGDTVRRLIRSVLKESHTLFVGISLADPNLVGPLSDLAKERKILEDAGEAPQPLPQSFLLVVPDPIEDVDPNLVYFYTKRRCDYLERELRVTPIILKAYSQVSQVLYELSLASGRPTEYLDNNKEASLRYGHRLRRALDQSYASIGLSDGDCPEGEAAKAISDRLFAFLESASGPGGMISQWREGFFTDWLGGLGLDHDYLREEGLAVFLWLRARSRRPDAGEPPPFALKLVGCSAYAHRAGWSFEKEEPILGNSSWLASRVAFSGCPTFVNLSDTRQLKMWKSLIAAPVIITGVDDDRDVLSIGAVTLNSTRRLVKVEELKQAHSVGADVRGLMPSTVGLLQIEERRALLEVLQTGTQRLLTPETTGLAREEGQ
jgi:hypothetical protein